MFVHCFYFVSILFSYFINHLHVLYFNHVSDESTERPCSIWSTQYILILILIIYYLRCDLGLIVSRMVHLPRTSEAVSDTSQDEHWRTCYVY